MTASVAFPAVFVFVFDNGALAFSIAMSNANCLERLEMKG